MPASDAFQRGSENDTRPLVLIVDDFEDARVIYETYLTYKGALEGEKLELLAAGFDEVIAKPCLPDDLERALIRLLLSPSTAGASQ